MSDYRNTPLCKNLSDVKRKKEELQAVISSAFPRQTNMYLKVQDKKLSFFNCFADIYNKKCAYCGVSSDIYDLKRFEIDHFICKAKSEDDNVAGKITNLRFSCSFCNRKKGGFFIDTEHQSLLDPDDNLISQVFKRTSDYQITISDDYKDDPFIKEFYSKLAFNNQLRRLDFLLMNMVNYSRTVKNIAIRDKLNTCIMLLLCKKNNLLFEQ